MSWGLFLVIFGAFALETQTRLDCRQGPLKNQESFTLQLHDGTDGFRMLLFIIFLWELIMVPKLYIKLKLILTLLRLNILCKLLDFGKCLSKSIKSFLMILVERLLLYGQLNQMFLLLNLLRLIPDTWTLESKLMLISLAYCKDCICHLPELKSYLEK